VNQPEIFSNGFLTAFNTVKAGGDSPLMNSLLAADSRLNPGETGSQMVRRLYASQLSLNSVGNLAGSISGRIQGTQSVVALSGRPYFFVPYPQYLGNGTTSGLNTIDSNDFSTYHSLEVQLQRRFSSGVAYNLAYTWAKSLDTRSFDPTLTVVSTANSQSASSTPFDINNRRLNYAPSDFDRRHSMQWNLLYELPFGKGKRWLSASNGLINRIVSGWEATSYGVLQTGRPFTVYSGTYTLSSVVQSTANCNSCSSGMGSPFLDAGSGLIWFYDQSTRAKFSAPAAGQLGSSQRNGFTGPRYFELDASFLKRIPVNERISAELRADVTNLTNTVSFGAPTADISSSIFGRINATTTSGSRKIQLGLKIKF
jgi:hypothetical protein